MMGATVLDDLDELLADKKALTAEVERLRAALKWYSEASPRQFSADGGQYAIATLDDHQSPNQEKQP